MHRLLAAVPILLLFACHPKGDSDTDGGDDDGDGVPNYDDCAPGDASVQHPLPYYPDQDADGFGSPAEPRVLCEAPPGYVLDSSDCNDALPAVFPGADETCDDIDDNCNGLIDENAIDTPEWYADADQDGFGSTALTIRACHPPNGYVSNPFDCDDTNSSINPVAFEVCNHIDDDCDALIDEDAIDPTLWHADADGDGYGSTESTIAACDVPPGYLADASDCKDSDPAWHPGAPENCDDPNDYNCDGSVGFADLDTDGAPACLDCDDTDPARFPAANEVCNQIDDDCDGLVDDADAGVDRSTMLGFWTDADGDGHGDATSPVLACVQPAGTATNQDDCDDHDAQLYPGQIEVCDLADNDCDFLVDDLDPSLDVGSASSWYADRDADTFGDAANVLIACTAPGRVAIAGDCDDTRPTVFPGAPEVCNARDDDCDGLVDDFDPDRDPSSATSWYYDVDGDGYGNPSTDLVACTQPPGMVDDARDCDDSDSRFHPGADETDCTDPHDYNCDGSFGTTDADGDGFVACQECDDSQAAVNPGASEVCNGIDDDCDQFVDDADSSLDPNQRSSFYTDADDDGFGNPLSRVQACAAPPGTVADDTDCDDADGGDFPGNFEVCDGNDDDCDQLVDDGDPSIDQTTGAFYYADADGDAHGDANDAVFACSLPPGRVSDATDCDDLDPTRFPGNPEVCNGRDDDCDLLVDDADADLDTSTASVWYRDADGDSYGDAALVACVRPSGYRADPGDCDDTRAVVNPAAIERCNGIDDDCDTLIDDLDPGLDGSTATNWYADADGDGFGAGAASATCTQPTGSVRLDGDCDDGDAAFHPGAFETCVEQRDLNCDGVVNFADVDGDGDARCVDCDDNDPGVGPSTQEICDADDVDEDCDGLADDADPDVAGQATMYADTDFDGYGDLGTPIPACDSSPGVVPDSTDCDDTRVAVNPAAQEICDANSRDQDCDGLVDDLDPSVTGQASYWPDLDADGYGDDAAAVQAWCHPPSDVIAVTGDCNDADNRVHPGATEVCTDTVDWNCDGSVGNVDQDQDGYPACQECDDSNQAINPGAQEICDPGNVDEDCDGASDDADPSVSGRPTWYADADDDGHGADSDPGSALCDPGTGVSALGDDCNDGNQAISPDATEVCDPFNVDEDCDGLSDDLDPSAIGQVLYFPDTDGDGYGDANGTGIPYCDPPLTAVPSDTDSDDGDPEVNPAATEVCNGIDDDSDGLVDDADPTIDPASLSTFWWDADGDGHGDAAIPIAACVAPADYVPDDTDCDDTSAAIYPGALEICDGGDTDEDCDNLADDADGNVSPNGFVGFFVDADGDGHGDPDTEDERCDPLPDMVSSSDDCDDGNPVISPDGTEICDALDTDEDCDGLIDDADPSVTGQSVYYPDLDGDGFGDVDGTGTLYCDPPADQVPNATDGDDGDPSVNPGATEVCNGIDDDSDGLVDDADPSLDAGTWATFYLDADGDGFGDPTRIASACAAPANYVANGADCDDAVPAINPGGQEVCDPDDTDEDCDTLVDDDDDSVTGQTLYYPDTDGDGFGDMDGTGTLYCDPPATVAPDPTDSDDTDPAVNPDATEICNGIDDDSDGLVDDDDPSVTGQTMYYPDTDGDGFGDVNGVGTLYCDPPVDVAPDPTDTDDTDPAVNPAATEVCNGIDDDSDGLVDDADDTLDTSTWSTFYLDADGDGFGDLASTAQACAVPGGYVTDTTDCNDGAPAIHPGGQEVCDGAGTDEDCDGLVDDADDSVSSSGFVGFFVDSDGDGHGDPGAEDERCHPLADMVGSSDDCNDADAAISPDGTEICDPLDVDEDCDSLVDDADPSVTGQSIYYPDLDGDGFGDVNGTGVPYCDPPITVAPDPTDTDDTDPAVNPDATEVCNGIDDDSDGLVDDDDPSVTGQTLYYPDTDGDGFGDMDGTGVLYCDPPAGTAPDPTDSDDTDPAVNPAATEVCNGIDDDSDGLVDDDDDNLDTSTWSTFYLDVDGDGFGDTATAQGACAAPATYITDDTDCDDTDPAISPVGTEICDPADVDEDCDGAADDADPSVTGQSLYYPDIDGDGFGDMDGTGIPYCDPPPTVSPDPTDSDDTDPAVNPDATEVCNGIDDDSDGLVDDDDPSLDIGTWSTFYVDGDGDGYGDAGSFETRCSASAGYVADGDDCDDTVPTTHPNGLEVCDPANTDEDCTGQADDDDPLVDPAGFTTFYEDADGDSRGNAAVSIDRCDPAAYVTDATDCDDGDAAISPDGTEICDALDTDEDCDGLVDDADPSVADQVLYYPDMDNDGFGDMDGIGILYCDPPPYVAPDPTDSDDTDPNVNPAATEVCNGIDDDSDGLVDDDDPTLDTGTWSPFYVDEDGDGYGDSGAFEMRCSPSTGHVADGTDCDDTVPTTHPNALEICDPADTDEDCSGQADDADPGVQPAGFTTFYADADGDSRGNAAVSIDRCDPAGYVTDSTDCNDADAAISPDLTEICDALDTDEDCDGLADDADPSVADQILYYPDLDNDGFGDVNGTGILYCDPPPYVAPDPTDTDDTDPNVNPAATEVCNGIDDDSDGLVDEADPTLDLSTETTFYADTDGDGYGDAGTGFDACFAPTGDVTDNTDCNDGDAAIHPDTLEICDGADTDEDCNGQADDADADVDSGGFTTFAIDVDGDGYGDTGAAEQHCDAASGQVPGADDCNDADPAIHPGVPELCDPSDVDENCNSLADDADVDALGKQLAYVDADADGFGDQADAGTEYCDPPVELSANATDCDDGDADVRPDATEICNTIDDDCDALVDDADPDIDVTTQLPWFADTDGDGFGSPGTEVDLCAAPGGYVADDTDCDDTRDDVNPGGIEVCDAVDADEDCNGFADDGDAGLVLPIWYADDDGDGYGVDDERDVHSCDEPASGYAGTGDDCNDADAAIHPDAIEVCAVSGPPVDEDCTGVADDEDPGTDPGTMTTWYVDLDFDTYGDVYDPGELSCLPLGPDNQVGDHTDCDDSDAEVYPGFPEIAYDGVDQDCSGADLTDVDGDGFDADVVGGPDCNDADPAINPAAAEICDNIDENCDGDPNGGGLPLFTFYTDYDNDGYGDANSPGILACGDICNVAPTSTDCNDADPTINPGQLERGCNDIDDDCIPSNDPQFRRNVGQGQTYTTIQAAINASHNGDEICVRDPYVQEQITISKRIWVTGVYGPAGSHIESPVIGSTVTMTGSARTVFEGFTVSNSHGSGSGAGISVLGKNAMLHDVVVTNNYCYDADCLGTGILAMNAHLGMFGVRMDHNYNFAPGMNCSGAGFAAVGSNIAGTDVWISDNDMECADNRGVAAYFIATNATFENMVIANNVADASQELGGTAYGTLYTNKHITIVNGAIINNRILGEATSGSGLGGGAYLQGNTSGIALTNVDVSGNDIAGAVHQGAAVYEDTGTGGLTATYSNFPGGARLFHGATNPVGTNGNLAVDPMYVSTEPSDDATRWDLRLMPGSLLIDAGDPAIEDPDCTRSDINPFAGPNGDENGWPPEPPVVP